MLKNKFKILSCIFIIAILVSSVCFATDDATVLTDENSGETTTTESENISLPSSEWIENDLYLCDEDIVIEGIVDGNVFAIGNTVTVKAEIGGDLFVIADNFTLDGGYIYSSIFGLANDMKINGIACDIYAIANNFTLEENGYIHRDLKLTSQNVSINGLVRKNAYLSAENITFSELANTYIYGNLTYSSNAEITIPENAVTGSVTYNKSEGETAPSTASKIVSILISVGLLLLNTFIVTILAIWLAPNFIKKVSNMGIGKTLIALPIGLVTLIAIPVISIVVLFTVIGIPLSFALLAIYFLLIAFATAFASMAISGLILKKSKSKVKFVLFALVSTIIIWALSLIPFVGGIVEFLILILGLGTVVSNLFRKVPNEVKE